MSFWKLDASDVVPGLIVLALVLLVLSGTPARSQETIPVLYDDQLPMDSDFTTGPDSTQLIDFGVDVPFSHVKVLFCDPFLGCDGHGDLVSFDAEVSSVFCTIEDDIGCYTGVTWNSVYESIPAFADTLVSITTGNNEPLLLAANTAN